MSPSPKAWSVLLNIPVFRTGFHTTAGDIAPTKSASLRIASCHTINASAKLYVYGILGRRSLPLTRRRWVSMATMTWPPRAIRIRSYSLALPVDFCNLLEHGCKDVNAPQTAYVREASVQCTVQHTSQHPVVQQTSGCAWRSIVYTVSNNVLRCRHRSPDSHFARHR
jgi:hypothetical protein